MGHTYTTMFYHCIWSTKGRRTWLTDTVKPRLIKFAGGVLRKRGCQMLEMNGGTEHVHEVATIPVKLAVSDVVRDVKSSTSAWIAEEFGLKEFHWQEGFAAFTVSKSALSEVLRYVQGQDEHHRRMTFEEEFIAFLDRHGIEYDPRYVFD